MPFHGCMHISCHAQRALCPAGRPISRAASERARGIELASRVPQARPSRQGAEDGQPCEARYENGMRSHLENERGSEKTKLRTEYRLASCTKFAYHMSIACHAKCTLHRTYPAAAARGVKKEREGSTSHLEFREPGCPRTEQNDNRKRGTKVAHSPMQKNKQERGIPKFRKGYS